MAKCLAWSRAWWVAPPGYTLPPSLPDGQMCLQLTAVTPAHLCIRPATPPRGTCTPPSGHAGTRNTNTRSISPASPTSTGKPPQAGPNRRRPNTGNHKKGWLLWRTRRQREPPRGGGRDHQCRWWLWCIFIFFLFCKGLNTFTGRLTFLLTAGGNDNDDNKEKTDSKYSDSWNLQRNHAKSAMLLPSCAFVVRNVHLCQSSPRVGAHILPAALALTPDQGPDGCWWHTPAPLPPWSSLTAQCCSASYPWVGCRLNSSALTS